MVCVAPCKVLECFQQHFIWACNWKSPMISFNSEPVTSAGLQLSPCQEKPNKQSLILCSFSGLQQFCWHVSDDILYKCTTAWLNGNSSATLYSASISLMHQTPAPLHYFRRLLWFTRDWMVYTEGRICSRCLATHSINETSRLSFKLLSEIPGINLWWTHPVHYFTIYILLSQQLSVKLFHFAIFPLPFSRGD